MPCEDQPVGRSLALVAEMQKRVAKLREETEKARRNVEACRSLLGTLAVRAESGPCLTVRPPQSALAPRLPFGAGSPFQPPAPPMATMDPVDPDLLNGVARVLIEAHWLSELDGDAVLKDLVEAALTHVGFRLTDHVPPSLVGLPVH
ncbi:MAG: hypothetical protein PGN34_08480 [Methylobacterium frigidaeris]